MIRVVHCKKEPHEYIGRPSPLGNPYVWDKSTPKGSTLPRYRAWLMGKIAEKDVAVCQEMNRLYKLYLAQGHLELGCWCAPQACHGDIIKEILEASLKKRGN